MKRPEIDGLPPVQTIRAKTTPAPTRAELVAQSAVRVIIYIAIGAIAAGLAVLAVGLILVGINWCFTTIDALAASRN